MKVALVHDWLTGMRGGEKCLEVFCELFPHADLYTLIYLPERISPTIRSMKVRASWVNQLPGVERYYRYGLPLFPSVVEKFPLRNYDLVLSSSHCVAKGILPNGALHLAYLYSPMRYVWDMYEAYFGRHAFLPARIGMNLWRGHLQRWDVRSAQRVHFFVAISKHIAAKIKAIYGRDATVIYPPVDTEHFYIREDQETYYLIVSALVPYKRIELAIEAFNQLGLPLKIAGDGPLKRSLEKKAGPNVEFLGWVEDRDLPDLYARCKALIFPGEEDFGIVPLEAHASGRPVIAYGKGGVLESVIPLNSFDEKRKFDRGPTGIFFTEPTPRGLIAAVEYFKKEGDAFDSAAIRLHASFFSRERFKSQIGTYIEERLKEWSEGK
jgi:glycosyltransferase involved in cell wall biosynthesis